MTPSVCTMAGGVLTTVTFSNIFIGESLKEGIR